MKLRYLLPTLFIIGFYGFYEIVVTSVPTTLNDFFLPGSQPGESGNLEDPSKCDNCHGGYDNEAEPAFNWRGSMMAQSARDPLYHAALTIANQDAPFSGDLCIRCHSPEGWLAGRSLPTDGSSLTHADMEGITCDFCHSLVKPTPIGVNPYPHDAIYTAQTYELDQAYLSSIAAIPPSSSNGMYVVDNSKSKRGPFSDAEANHQFIYSPFHSSSELCGTCHDVSNPVFSAMADENGKITGYAPNSFDEAAPSFKLNSMLHIERTYSEWKMSAYNTPQGVQSDVFGGNLEFVSTCQDCHMKDITGQGCNKNPPIRDNLPKHDMTGANTFIPRTLYDLYPNDVDTVALNAGMDRAREMLTNAATMGIIVNGQQADVTVINETGHKLPSGYPEGRRIWLNIKAWGENGEIFESGHYDFNTAQLTQDIYAKIYEVKPGVSPGLATILGLESGPSFHFVLNDTVFKDNRIPPRGFTNANFESVQAEPIGYQYNDGQYWDISSYIFSFSPVAVEAKLYYQTASKEYIEFLRDANVTDNKGQIMYDLWQAHGKSTPELMASTSWGAPIIDIDGDGYIAAVDCDDFNASVYPGSMELVDCIDNNCNGIIDELPGYELLMTWTGCNGSNQWDNANNWSLGRIPVNGDHVIIPSSTGSNFFPSLNTTINLKSLEVHAGGNLTIQPEFSITITEQNMGQEGALIINGMLTNQGSLTISNPLSKGVIISQGGILNNSGNITINNYQTFGIENKGQFILQSNGEITILENDAIAVSNSEGAVMQLFGTFCIKF